jgi:hypothetical protein
MRSEGFTIKEFDGCHGDRGNATNEVGDGQIVVES